MSKNECGDHLKTLPYFENLAKIKMDEFQKHSSEELRNGR